MSRSFRLHAPLAIDNSAAMRAASVVDTFRICDGLYLIGALEHGLTLYNQQVRAHNLIWALWELERAKRCKVGRVAVIGAGAAGLEGRGAGGKPE